MNRRSTAQVNRYSIQKALNIWLLQHAQACVFSLGQIFKAPLTSFLTTAVIGIALSLPVGFYLLLDNCQRVAQGWDNSARISLFMTLDLEESEVLSLAERIRALEHVNNVTYISPDTALEEYRSHSGFADWVNSLDENPLPAVLLVQPDLTLLGNDSKERLLQQLRSEPGVDTVQFDRQWIQRLFAIISIIEHAVTILSVLLGVSVLLIVGNTIRLAIYNRRTEIEVHKLFGATEGFIQRPFLYSGFFHGLGGSLIAWGLLSISILLLHGPVERLAELYSSNFTLEGLSLTSFAILCLSGALLGLTGSWISVRRHMRSLEPA